MTRIGLFPIMGKKYRVSRCPLIRKLSLTTGQMMSGGADWAKDVCLLFCPVKECVEDFTRRLKPWEVALFQRTHIPAKVEGLYVCPNCYPFGGGMLFDDVDEPDEWKCINCEHSWRKPRR